MIFFAALALTVASGDLHEPFLAEADGKPIQASVGHLAPIMYDFDEDGLKDLVVGTFSPGVIRLYKNIGEAGKPKFSAFQTVKADGKEVTVESG